jgi:two-component system NarL family sensor kinase
VVFAVARELLANVGRHARAERVDVDVVRVGETIRLTVTDDGQGIEPSEQASAVERGHIGLAACERRLRAIGGTLRIGSAPGAGTWIEAHLPAGSAAGDAVDRSRSAAGAVVSDVG